MRITIFGRRWRLLFVPAKELPNRKRRVRDGDCDMPHAPGQAPGSRTLRIYDKLDEAGSLETIIHEFKHAAEPHVAEEYVEHFARDLARVLRRCGWRRVSASGG